MQVNENQIQERRKENGIELLTLKEVAEICRVSVATVKYWTALRKIKVIKLGKHPLFRREELLRFINAAEVGGEIYLPSNAGHAQR
jgi:excisionase family DNA binding protein